MISSAALSYSSICGSIYYFRALSALSFEFCLTLANLITKKLSQSFKASVTFGFHLLLFPSFLLFKMTVRFLDLIENELENADAGSWLVKFCEHFD